MVDDDGDVTERRHDPMEDDDEHDDDEEEEEQETSQLMTTTAPNKTKESVSASPIPLVASSSSSTDTGTAIVAPSTISSTEVSASPQVPPEFADDARNHLGCANGNIFVRKPGTEGVHDGQIMVRLQKKRFLVLDYGTGTRGNVPANEPSARSHGHVTSNENGSANGNVCGAPQCPKTGVPAVLYDSNPHDTPSLYVRSGLCFTCQRRLNEKRRTQRKKRKTSDRGGDDVKVSTSSSPPPKQQQPQPQPQRRPKHCRPNTEEDDPLSLPLLRYALPLSNAHAHTHDEHGPQQVQLQLQVPPTSSISTPSLSLSFQAGTNGKGNGNGNGDDGPVIDAYHYNKIKIVKRVQILSKQIRQGADLLCTMMSMEEPTTATSQSSSTCQPKAKEDDKEPPHQDPVVVPTKTSTASTTTQSVTTTTTTTTTRGSSSESPPKRKQKQKQPFTNHNYVIDFEKLYEDTLSTLNESVQLLKRCQTEEAAHLAQRLREDALSSPFVAHHTDVDKDVNLVHHEEGTTNHAHAPENGQFPGGDRSTHPLPMDSHGHQHHHPMPTSPTNRHPSDHHHNHNQNHIHHDCDHDLFGGEEDTDTARDDHDMILYSSTFPRTNHNHNSILMEDALALSSSSHKYEISVLDYADYDMLSNNDVITV